jgi:hypothetical protein
MMARSRAKHPRWRTLWSREVEPGCGEEATEEAWRVLHPSPIPVWPTETAAADDLAVVAIRGPAVTCSWRRLAIQERSTENRFRTRGTPT